MTAFLITVAISIAISVVLTVAKMLLFPPKRPEQIGRDIEKPADGKYNERQNVPSLTDGFGRVKKGGDVVFLEEVGGVAYWIIVVLGNRIEGFVEYYLHDELATVDSGTHLVTSPAHFGNAVRIETRLGLPAETAWDLAVAAFPTIWTTAHRGDGLAQLMMRVETVNEDMYGEAFPNQMPLLTSVLDMAWLYDPRQESHDPDDPSTWAYSRNIALGRLYHLTRPSGGKLALSDMYLPDWAAAADVCDEIVVNRNGDDEPRYAGGLWWRHSADPVEIGLAIDQAGELVVYTRADGKIGVHAGAFTWPDIRITEDEILEFNYAANRSAATTVLAVRGRYTDPDNVYNTVDAAIWGDPYVGDEATQRTKTIDNAAVQSHNHMQRLQKIAFIRANAPRVSLTIPYRQGHVSRLIAQRRFVTVHYPARGLNEAVVEIINRPRLDLNGPTNSVEAIVVSEALYDFDAATEEGDKPPVVVDVEAGGVPLPTTFAITIFLGEVSGGQTGAQARASWDYVSDALSYELEYQLADESVPPAVVKSQIGETTVQTPFLIAGAEYRFRLRSTSNGRRSEWTSYINEDAIADVTPPAAPTGFAISAPSTTATLSWTNPNSANFFKTVLYRHTVDDFSLASPIFTSFGGPGVARSFDDGPHASGEFFWWVAALNASDVASSEVGSLTHTF